MALAKKFSGAVHEMNTLDRFEAKIIKIMRDAAKKALKDTGYKFRKGDSGDIVIVGYHLPEETWDHCFSIDISTRCQH